MYECIDILTKYLNLGLVVVLFFWLFIVSVKKMVKTNNNFDKKIRIII